jgi:hypothetical protein
MTISFGQCGHEKCFNQITPFEKSCFLVMSLHKKNLKICEKSLKKLNCKERKERGKQTKA